MKVCELLKLRNKNCIKPVSNICVHVVADADRCFCTKNKVLTKW